MKILLRILFLIAAASLLLSGAIQAWRSSCRLDELAVPSEDVQPAARSVK